MESLCGARRTRQKATIPDRLDTDGQVAYETGWEWFQPGAGL